MGSLTGLITFSHLLSYILKHYKSITISAIIGFIIGSLGVVWPWKKTIYKLDENGQFLFDSRGEKVIAKLQTLYSRIRCRNILRHSLYCYWELPLYWHLKSMAKKQENHMHKLGLLGKNISYSFSKAYFKKKFEDEQIDDVSYENFDIEDIEAFPALIKNTIDLKGMNVTIPYKEAVIPFLRQAQ